MFVCDLAFALWLGATIGFGGVERGSVEGSHKETAVKDGNEWVLA